MLESTFRNVDSVKTIKDGKTPQLVFHMSDGSKLLVDPENRSVSFFKNETDFDHDHAKTFMTF